MENGLPGLENVTVSKPINLSNITNATTTVLPGINGTAVVNKTGPVEANVTKNETNGTVESNVTAPVSNQTNVTNVTVPISN